MVVLVLAVSSTCRFGEMGPWMVKTLQVPGTFSGELVFHEGSYFLSSAGKIPYRDDSGDGVIVLDKNLKVSSFVRSSGDVLGFWKRGGSLYVFVLGKGIFLLEDGVLTKVRSAEITSPPSPGGKWVFFGTPYGFAYFDGETLNYVKTGFPVLGVLRWDSWLAVIGEKFQVYSIDDSSDGFPDFRKLYEEKVPGRVGSGYQRLFASGSSVAYVSDSQVRVFRISEGVVDEYAGYPVFGGRAVVMADIDGSGDPVVLVGARKKLIVFDGSPVFCGVDGTVMGMDVVNVGSDLREEVVFTTTSGFYMLYEDPNLQSRSGGKRLTKLCDCFDAFLFKPSSVSVNGKLVLIAGGASGKLYVVSLNGVDSGKYSYSSKEKVSSRAPARTVPVKNVLVVDPEGLLTRSQVESKLPCRLGEGSKFLIGSEATASAILREIATGNYDVLVISAPLKKVEGQVYPVLKDTNEKDIESTSVPIGYLREVFKEVYIF